MSMLYERHFERMERNRWLLTKDVPWEQLQPELLPEGLLKDLRYICLTELSALYATEMFIRDFYEDIDFCAFVSVWFYEEMKHFLTNEEVHQQVRRAPARPRHRAAQATPQF